MKITKLLVFAVFEMLLSSCMHNKLRYIQDKNEVFGQISEYSNKAPDYKLENSDILYIKIHSTNKGIVDLFEIDAQAVQNTLNTNGGSFYLRGFTVNDSGCIEMPVIGKIELQGLTIDEAQIVVQKKVDEFLNNAIVKVKLVSFYVDFLGEVSHQGRLSVMQENISILDAISQMGGITDYGNRKNVLVVRQTKKGTKTFRVDLTKRELLSSEQFYMLPYDMVVVEPLRRKSFRLGIRDYSLVLTTITSTITMILVLTNFLDKQ